MFRTVVTLMRGSAEAASEKLADTHALLLLDQQMRDAQSSINRSQRALAMALAENAQEVRRNQATDQHIAGIETRARAALADGREDLAMAAAEVLAGLEAERDAGQRACQVFAPQIARLRRAVDDAERRLAELHRGRRVARVADAVQGSRLGRSDAGLPDLCTLSEAEATLARLQDRQAKAAGTSEYLDVIIAETRPQTIEERLEGAGFGPATRPTAASVLARLKQGSRT